MPLKKKKKETPHSSDAIEPSEGPDLQKAKTVHKDIEEVKDVMRDNIEKLNERGERLERLQEQSDKLQMETQAFTTHATQVKRNLWWKNKKLTIAICAVFLLIIALAVVFVILRFSRW